MTLNIREHQHPHGPQNLPPNVERIWICEECEGFFTDEEIREDLEDGDWGHKCYNSNRCESHIEPYIPDLPEDGAEKIADEILRFLDEPEDGPSMTDMSKS